MPATEFTFLTVDGHGRPLEPGSRASIRSRCMKGVNVRQDSRRSKRKARKASETIAATESLSKNIESPEIASCQVTSCGPLSKSLQVRTDELGFDSSRLPSTAWRLVVKFNALLDVAYPLETSFENIDPQEYSMIDHLTLLNDNKTLLESIFLATYTVDDLCSGTKLSPRSQRILCTILSSLNRSLGYASGQQSYTTIFIILILLFAAESFRDFDAVSIHLDGLRKLLELRETKPVPLDSKLLFKIQQVDLRMSLATGRPLYFPFHYYYPQAPAGIIRPPSVIHWLMVHPALMACYQTLQALSNHANQYRCSTLKKCLDWFYFQSQVSTGQTLLIGIGNGHLPVVSEALRLGMLAFLSTLSRSPTRKAHLPIFASQLEECCLAMKQEQDPHKPLLIWLMLMGCISTIDTSGWISSAWSSSVPTDLSWEAVQKVVVEIPWIHMIHDEPGERNYRHLQARRDDCVS
ncbi:hypothetical protein FVEG_13378 [Fusarium verticillioides 7600]|uniref:Transcription factor domain-containing protein n=1 Tax=Gibberella moniliformis (strain M3125 / FGSC 7600) TaxID=334819 RepID=W7NGE7_GIBM7|nr:hypothetical protein FVEG_13378 [Fusarium verticillioides 7600]EWG55367.1 hypothetical protein FVEG_13378 [Fusarium verticillioides 7600]